MTCENFLLKTYAIEHGDPTPVMRTQLMGSVRKNGHGHRKDATHLVGKVECAGSLRDPTRIQSLAVRIESIHIHDDRSMPISRSRFCYLRAKYAN